MNRKLPIPRDYLIGIPLMLILAIPVGIAIIVIATVYWTCWGIRTLGAISEQEQIS